MDKTKIEKLEPLQHLQTAVTMMSGELEVKWVAYSLVAIGENGEQSCVARFQRYQESDAMQRLLGVLEADKTELARKVLFDLKEWDESTYKHLKNPN